MICTTLICNWQNRLETREHWIHNWWAIPWLTIGAWFYGVVPKTDGPDLFRRRFPDSEWDDTISPQGGEGTQKSMDFIGKFGGTSTFWWEGQQENESIGRSPEDLYIYIYFLCHQMSEWWMWIHPKLQQWSICSSREIYNIIN